MWKTVPHLHQASLGKTTASLKPLVSGTNSETSGRTVDDPSGFGRGCPGFGTSVFCGYLGGVFSKEIGADDLAMISLLLYYLCYWHVQYNFGSNQFVFAQNIKLYFMNLSVTSHGPKKDMVILERLGGRSSGVRLNGARLVACEAFQESICTRQTRILGEEKHIEVCSETKTNIFRYWTWFSVPPLRRFSRNKYEMLMIWQEMPSRGLRKPSKKPNKPGGYT